MRTFASAASLQLVPKPLTSPSSSLKTARWWVTVTTFSDYMASKLGVTLNQVNLPFQGLLPGLMTHKFDFVATSVGINPERARRFAFSEPVGVVDTVLVVRSNDSAIAKARRFAGHVVGHTDGFVVTANRTSFRYAIENQGRRLFGHETLSGVSGRHGRVDEQNAGCGHHAVEYRCGADEEGTGPIPRRWQDRRAEMLAWVANPKTWRFVRLSIPRSTELTKSGQLAHMQKQWFGYTMNLPSNGYLPEGAV